MRVGSVRACFLSATQTHTHSPFEHLPRHFSSTPNLNLPSRPLDPRLNRLGPLIKDDFATIRANYRAPRYPIVLAHGLLGFDEISLAGSFFPRMQYWRGIKEALSARGIQVVTTAVPPLASIEQRAVVLDNEIKSEVGKSPINVVAHSMGGLDARYLISSLRPKDQLNIKSLTTVATPHRGSSFADFIFREIGEQNVSRVYKLFARLGLDSGAFSQLTRKYMEETFNPANPDDPTIRYFSYGAQFSPSLWSMFRFSHGVIEGIEGPNDGLVSVQSSRWGADGYKGTLDGVSHLDLINW